jgi:thiol-disulfide isomerase/thioredoxin
MKRFCNIVVSLALILTFSCTALPPPKKEKKESPKKLTVGDIVTDFTLPDITNDFTLPDITNKEILISFDKDIKGKSKVIAIIFITVACTTCKAEMELLSGLVKEHGEDLKVYAVEVDIYGYKKMPLSKDRLKEYNLTYWLLDSNFSIPRKFGFIYLPSLVIADRDGKILFAKKGYSSDSDAPAEITKAIKDALGAM